MTTVSTVHINHGSVIVQAHEAAIGARVTDNNGHYLDVRYDAEHDTFVIEASDASTLGKTSLEKTK
jgi:hypothetical protein